jgi:hypothetical protein
MSASQVTAPLTDRAGCSVKDSYADLDLTQDGFDVLFTAQWIYRDPAPPKYVVSEWATVATVREFDEWSAANGSVGLFPPTMMNDPSLRFLLAKHGDQVAGGAIANHGAGVVGISNVFMPYVDPAEAWSDIAAVIATCFPDTTLVGYEQGDDLLSATGAGFISSGPLRVWCRDA